MKRKESEIVSVKEWGSPCSNIQLFMPQVYCDPCAYESVTSLGNWTNSANIQYIDLNDNGSYDAGERFQNSGKVNYKLGISDQTTNGLVKVGYVEIKTGNSWVPSNHSLSSGDPYSQHTSGGNTYRIANIGTGRYKIKIEDGYAYYNTVDAS